MPYYPHGPKEPPRKPPLKEQPLFRLILLCVSALLVSCGAFRLIEHSNIPDDYEEDRLLLAGLP